MRISVSGPDGLGPLPELERAADSVFAAIGITDLPPPAGVAELAHSLAVLVAGDPPRGFLRLEEVDGRAHIEQLSVLPEWTRRGIGSELVREGLRWASAHGYLEASLITFRDVLWNTPFHRPHGSRPLTQLTPGLAALRETERRRGLDALGHRVVLYRSVTGKV